jgi:Holliday junction DNA helicase RuvA
MISYLRGKVLSVRDSYAIIDVSGVGYKVTVNPEFASHLHAEEEAEVYIYTQVREDILALFGFKNLEELDFFEMLISVSGIGPKAALNILAVASIDKIRASIQNQDPTLLSSVSGIGKKTAEKVVIELKNKVGATGNLFAGEKAEDVYDALMQLGFRQAEISASLAELPPDLKSTEEKLKYCLARLRK